MNKTHVKSCYHLGFMYKSGVSVKKDLSKAKKYFKKACDLDPYYGVIFKPL
ncbi:SEL1-like repeat protein [Campylobacter sp. MG1]|uniref:SEL1-like repeat protein n=1 Tax=Campylobacter sp. MG1 TaxID=2976332 RepID=UPI00226CE9DB|nr:SEL1-like repeat protein [Campylobacter sp. MG1]